MSENICHKIIFGKTKEGVICEEAIMSVANELWNQDNAKFLQHI